MEPAGRHVLIASLAVVAALAADGDVREVHAERVASARRSARRLLGIALAEVVAGSAAALAWQDQKEGGIALAVGGAAHGLTAVAALDLARRREHAFSERAAWADTTAGRWPELERQLVWSVGRDGRSDAAATGFWAGGATTAVAVLALDVEPAHRSAATGAALSCGLGALHHGLRWTQSVQLASTLGHPPPR